MSVIKH